MGGRRDRRASEAIGTNAVRGGMGLARWKLAALEAASEGIMLTDPHRHDNPIVYVNSGFTRITGFESHEVVGRNCRFLRGPGTDPATSRALHGAIERGEPISCEVLNYRKDGSPFVNQLHITPVHDDAGALTHFVGIQLDVSCQREAEARERMACAELSSARKFAALGEMAAGVAHEINNPMTIVAGRSSQLARLLAEIEKAWNAGEPAPRALFNQAASLNADIRAAAFRTARIASGLLSFTSHEGGGGPLRVRDLPDLVESALARARDKAASLGVALRLERCCEACYVRVDGHQIETIVGNVVDNALDAASAAQGGWVLVTVAHRQATAVVEVVDSGALLPDEIAERVFHPFFTTKGPGQSTGLGLAVARGFAERNQAELRLDRSGGRNLFRLSLAAAPSGEIGARLEDRMARIERRLPAPQAQPGF